MLISMITVAARTQGTRLKKQALHWGQIGGLSWLHPFRITNEPFRMQTNPSEKLLRVGTLQKTALKLLRVEGPQKSGRSLQPRRVTKVASGAGFRSPL